MAIWFEGSNEVECSLDRVAQSLADLGAHHLGVIALMPGLSGVELVEQGEDFVVIRTSEGLMKRTGISAHVGSDDVVMEFDEEYQAGRLVTTKSASSRSESREGLGGRTARASTPLRENSWATA